MARGDQQQSDNPVQVVRLPLIGSLQSRSSSSTSKDLLVHNAYIEVIGKEPWLRKRMGNVFFGATTQPANFDSAQGITQWNGNPYYVVFTNVGVNFSLSIYSVNSSGVSALVGSKAITRPTFRYLSFEASFNNQYLVLATEGEIITVTSAGVVATATFGAGPVKPFVNGLVYLDGYHFVMDSNGVIFNSNLEDPTNWAGTSNSIQAEAEPDLGAGIAKHMNYVVAFNERSTELFFDNANPNGSPLARYDAAKLDVGCASGGSIVDLAGNLFWIGTSKQYGMGIYLMRSGELVAARVSTPIVDAILEGNVDGIGRVYGRGFIRDGHTFYMVRLTTCDLVYQLDANEWFTWSTEVSGADSASFAPTFFTSNLSGNATLGGQGEATVWGLDDNVLTKVVRGNGIDQYGAGSSDPRNIYMGYRSSLADFDTAHRKFFRRMDIIGDKLASSANLQVRYTDDDYNTFSAYRNIDLSLVRPQLRNLGSGRRRAWDFLFVNSQDWRWKEVELEFEAGAS